MASIRWFNQFYTEIDYHFYYLPGTEVPRTFKVDLYKSQNRL